MSCTLEVLPNEPVVVVSLNEDFDVAVDTPAVSLEYGKRIERIAGKVSLIIDFRPAKNALSMNSVIAGANLAARGEIPFFTHPRNKEVIWVATTDAMKLAAKGLSSDIFGAMNVCVFETIEEAISHARGQGSG